MIKHLAVIIIFLPFVAFSQVSEYKFGHLEDVKELENTSVTAIEQDDKGFLWFGTSNGLMRYNGFTVKVYKNELENDNSLSDNNVKDLKTDKKGNLWIATQGGGLNQLILEEDRFIRYQHSEKNKNSISGNAIWSLMVDLASNVWAGSWSNGLNKYNPENNQFNRIASNSTEPVLAIHEDVSGGIWFASDGLSYYDQQTGNINTYSSNPNDSTTLSSNNIRAIEGDENGNLWIATDNNGLNRFDPKTGRFERILKSPGRLNSNSIYDIFFEGNLMWLATTNGINIWDLSTDTFHYFQYDPADLQSLSNNNPRTIYKDNANSIWIGNEGGRINKTIQKKDFQTIDVTTGLSNNLIRSLYRDSEGRIWIGTQGGGLNLYKQQSDEIIQVPQDSSKSIYVGSSEISAIYEADNGKYWVGTWGSGIFILDFISQQVDHLTHDNNGKNSVPDDRIQLFHKDKFGVFWVGTENGLSKYDEIENKWTLFTGLNAATVQGQAFVEQKDGTIWAGTWNGLNKISADREYIESWPKADEKKRGTKLSNVHVISLYLDDENSVLWIGTFGGGLNRLDLNTMEFTAFTEKDGLSNGVIYGIKADENGNLWMSTNNGLSKFSPDKKSFRNYDKSEGLQSNEFYWGAAYANEDGTLMFGGINGLNIFDPKDIEDNKVVPPVVISSFEIYNKPVGVGEDSLLQKSITYTNDIDLTYKDAVLTFEFAALNYNYPEKNQYAYMLEGFDDSWNYVGNKHNATYTNLDPGDYVFRVKGSNNDNVWNEAGASLSIYISPPFWRTWWFYLLLGLGAVGMVRAFIKYREKSLEEDKRLLESKIQEAKDEVETQKQAIADQREQERERIWKDQGMVEMGEILSSSKDNLDSLAQSVLKNLVKYIGLQAAAIYIAEENEEGTEVLKMMANYGYSAKTSFEVGNGLVGECYKDGEVNYLQGLPQEYLKVDSGLGEGHPGEILLVPLKYEELIIGVMELASFKKIEEYKRDFLVQFSVRLTTAINTTRLSEKTSKLLEESKFKEEELKLREEELQQNLEEMQAMNEDRDRRSKELEGTIKNLKEEVGSYKKKLKELDSKN